MKFEEALFGSAVCWRCGVTHWGVHGECEPVHTRSIQIYIALPSAAHPRVKVVVFFSFLLPCRGAVCFVSLMEVFSSFDALRLLHRWVVTRILKGNQKPEVERCNSGFLECVSVKVCGVSTLALLGIEVLSDEAWLLQFSCFHRNYHGKHNQ